MAKDDANGDAIRLVEYWMRKACGGELPLPEDWGKIMGLGRLPSEWPAFAQTRCGTGKVTRHTRTNNGQLDKREAEHWEKIRRAVKSGRLVTT